MKQKGSKRRLTIFAAVTALMVVLALLGGQSYHVYAATTPIRIPANVEWVSTGIWVEEGQTISLSTRGKAITGPLNIYPGAKSGPDGQIWNLGCGQYEVAPPPCALDDAPYGALVGRVGPSSDPFLIGGSSSFISPASGYLYLAVNDNLGFYSDNLSGFTVLFRSE
ncbi:MAG TPA: hypothetical protein VFY83_05170 [Anaerolineales bacterium]|nr:hypothetical protein [Anaerolineales bacterium]